MRHAFITLTLWLLFNVPVLAQSTTDSTAWRVFFDLKAEAPGNHSEAFTSYLTYLGLSTSDSAALQSALESYAVNEATLKTTSNLKRDSYAAAYNSSAIATEQASYDVQIATLVGQTEGGLSATLSADGFSRLNAGVQHLKTTTIIPVPDATTMTHNHSSLMPASFRMSRPQGTQMGFQYTQIGDFYAVVTGWDSSGNPSGSAYVQLGIQGTTNPCSGPCVTATHTAIAEYGHNGGALQIEPLWSNPPYYSDNTSYTYSWTFGPGSSYVWSPEYAFVKMTCSMAGTVINNNPLPVKSSPFKSETALTWATTSGQVVKTVSCFGGGSCPTTVQPISLYCKYNPPDYVPTYFQFTAEDGTQYMEFEQYGFCLGSTGGSWSCLPDSISGIPGGRLVSTTLSPPSGGATCTKTTP